MAVEMIPWPISTKECCRTRTRDRPQSIFILRCVGWSNSFFFKSLIEIPINTHSRPWSDPSEYEARMKTRNAVCMRARAFRVNTFSLIYRCSLLYIYCCLLNSMRLTLDPVLIFVTLSWPRFLTLFRTSDAMQVSLLISLPVKWYICLSRDSNPLSHDSEALSWTKHVDQNVVCMTKMTSIMRTSLVLLLLFVRV